MPRLVLISDISISATLEKNNLILTHALDAVQDAVYAIGEDGNELFLNQNIKRFDESNRKKMLKELISVFKTGKQVKDRYLNYTTIDKKQVHILSSYFPVQKNGKTIAVVSINKFITEIRTWLRRAIDLQSQLQECTLTNSSKFNGTRYHFEDIVGDSTKMKSTCKKAIKISQNVTSILIQGETGVGKEMFAQSIHNEGNYADEPFIAVVCSAIPESLLESTLFGTKRGAFTGSVDTTGLFEQAKQGTLFLDEINSMPLYVQSKLLRVLEEKCVRRVGGSVERPIKCRIISATNENALELVKKDRLRKDLFYRLAGFVLSIPPLRERSRDIFRLTDHFLHKMNKLYGKNVTGLSPELKKIFDYHHWPGNIRELSHIIEGAFNKVENEYILTPDHLPDYFQPNVIKQKNTKLQKTHNEDHNDTPLPEMLKKIEKEWILKALTQHQGNVTKSAETLGIQRQNLQARMRKLNISKQLVYN